MKHDIMLYIISNPTVRSQKKIGHIFGVTNDYVCKVMKELNIQPSKRPLFYKG